MNYVFVAGNIGKAESRKVGEDYVVRFSVASNSRVKKGGNWETETEWFNCEYWTKSERVLENFRQCVGVAVIGARRTTRKEDRVYDVIKAIDIHFVFPRKEKGNQDEPF